MARLRSSTPRHSANRISPLVEVSQRMVTDIEHLVQELEEVRADNEALRGELRSAVDMLQRASAALSGARESGRAGGAGRRRGPGRRAQAPKGRATDPAVTTEVVRAVLAKLGEASAAEIAAEITKAGVPVSGRAVRFLAAGAGATAFDGPDGKKRYRL